MCQAAVFCPRESSGPSLEPAGALGCLLHFSQITPDSYWSPIHEEWENIMALGSSEWHSVYWEMISELPDRITLYSLFKLVMEDDQMRECLARRNKAIEYIRYILYISVCQTILWQWVMWKSSFDTRQVFLLRWDRVWHFTCICTACVCTSCQQSLSWKRDSTEAISLWKISLIFIP